VAHNRPPFSSQECFESSDSKNYKTIFTLIKYDTNWNSHWITDHWYRFRNGEQIL